MPSSTFHDRVNGGTIVHIKGMRGFYKLNDSLRRFGLQEVPGIPQKVAGRTTEDIIRMAFHTIDPDVFPPPSWLLDVEAIVGCDADHATLRKRCRLVAVRGNHEMMMLQARDDRSLRLNWIACGGDTTLDTHVYGGGWLTCLETESGMYWQANQKGELRCGRLKQEASPA